MIADDFPAILDKCRELLRAEFDVLAAVDNGEAALDAVIRLKPDLLILDVAMPGLNGLDTAKRLRESCHPVKIVFVSVSDDSDQVAACRCVGAKGYVLKARMRSELVDALRQVLAGKTFFPVLNGFAPGD